MTGRDTAQPTGTRHSLRGIGLSSGMHAPRLHWYDRRLGRLRRLVARAPHDPARVERAARAAATRDAASGHPDEYASGPYPHELTITARAHAADRAIAGASTSLTAGTARRLSAAEQRRRRAASERDARRHALERWEQRLADHDAAAQGPADQSTADRGDEGRRYDRHPNLAGKAAAVVIAAGEVALVKFLTDSLGEGDARLSWAMAVAIVGVTLLGAHGLGRLAHHRGRAGVALAVLLGAALTASSVGVVWLRLHAYESREAWRQELITSAASELGDEAVTAPAGGGPPSAAGVLVFGGVQALLIGVVVVDSFHDHSAGLALRRRLHRRRRSALRGVRAADRSLGRAEAVVAEAAACASRLDSDLSAVRAETAARFEAALRTYREELVAAVAATDPIRAGELAVAARSTLLAGPAPLPQPLPLDPVAPAPAGPTFANGKPTMDVP